MPIYEYKCDNKDCGIEVEYLQKISDPPISICPECKKPTLRKLISASGFRLKGGGWYETDFKNDTKKKRNLSSNDNENSSSKDTKAKDVKSDNSAENTAKTKSDKTTGEGKKE